jgi:hypothetical protein
MSVRFERIARRESGGTSETGVADKFDGEGSEAAGRYARAVFDLAKDAKQLDVVEQDFAKFVAAWRESADLRPRRRNFRHPEVPDQELRR